MRLGETLALRLQRCALAAAMLIVAMPSAMAQPGANTGKAAAPNALQGFSQNRGQPVQIEAAHLEVRDKDKVATFSGNVKVVQGDTTMRCKSLVVYYEQGGGDNAGQDNRAATKAAQPGFGGSSQIKKLEARGGVTVVQKDQTASGETGLFDMKSNTVTLIGHVIVSQGQNVIRGERVVVDLTTGVSHVESGSGPVRVLIQQQPQTPGAPGSASPPHRFGPQRSSSK